MLLIVRWFGSELVVKMDELKSGVVVGGNCCCCLIQNMQSALCWLKFQLLASGNWVPVNVPSGPSIKSIAV